MCQFCEMAELQHGVEMSVSDWLTQVTVPVIKGLDTDQLRLTAQQQQRYTKNRRL